MVAADDFISLDETPAFGPRKEDGGLPDIDYLHLVPGSDLIDAGEQNISIDVSDVPDGLYIYRVTINETPFVASKLVKGD